MPIERIVEILEQGWSQARDAHADPAPLKPRASGYTSRNKAVVRSINANRQRLLGDLLG